MSFARAAMVFVLLCAAQALAAPPLPNVADRPAAADRVFAPTAAESGVFERPGAPAVEAPWQRTAAAGGTSGRARGEPLDFTERTQTAALPYVFFMMWQAGSR